MENSNPIFETEYRYLISRKDIKKSVPKEIEGFSLKESKIIEIEDYIFERKTKTLKSDKVGIRVRKVGDKYEFTYKKFLGKNNGAAVFEEISKKIDKRLFNKLSSGLFDKNELPILKKQLSDGELYVFFKILNKRSVYLFEKGDSAIEMVVEDLEYLVNDQKIYDAMIELEVIKAKTNTVDIHKFAKNVKNLFSASETDEGKNSRAMTLLGITYE